MATQLLQENAVETESTTREPGSRDVAQWVLQELGTPKRLLRVEAKPLWGNYFRVNVYCTLDVGVNAKDVAVTDSFFIYRTDDGCLSDPEVVRKYPNPTA